MSSAVDVPRPQPAAFVAVFDVQPPLVRRLAVVAGEVVPGMPMRRTVVRRVVPRGRMPPGGAADSVLPVRSAPFRVPPSGRPFRVPASDPPFQRPMLVAAPLRHVPPASGSVPRRVPFRVPATLRAMPGRVPLQMPATVPSDPATFRVPASSVVPGSVPAPRLRRVPADRPPPLLAVRPSMVVVPRGVPLRRVPPPTCRVGVLRRVPARRATTTGHVSR